MSASGTTTWSRWLPTRASPSTPTLSVCRCRTSEAASWEPNVVYEELQWCTLTCISEERQEEAINRLLKPAAPPDSGNGVVVPHEAPDGPPKPKKKGKK